MGTRNLTMVIANKEVKIAQYCQWDGYPSGQGETILKFLLTLKGDYKAFKDRVSELKFFTKKEIEKLADADQDKVFSDRPWLSRDLGGDILNAVYNGVWVENGLDKKKTHKFKVDKLQDESEFAADSLFCEWAYVIDLDKKTLEVYRGFNTKPLAKKERFYYLLDKCDAKNKNRKDPDGTPYGYYPVRLLKKFSLTELPTVAQFIKQLDKLVEKEEAEA